MVTAKLFFSGNSQAVRLPKEYRIRGDEVLLKRVGSAVVLIPKNDAWTILFDALADFPDDFSVAREQPQALDREPIE